MEKSCTDEWFYFLIGVITVGKIMSRHFTEEMCGEQGFKTFHKTVHLDKFTGLCYASWIVLQDKYINYCMTYLAAQQQNKLVQCPRLLSQCSCSFQLRNSATGLREARTNSISSLAISVLEYYVVIRLSYFNKKKGQLKFSETFIKPTQTVSFPTLCRYTGLTLPNNEIRMFLLNDLISG